MGEKIRKKIEKEEEKKKFLKWKKEKEVEEYDQRATENLRKIKAEMDEKEAQKFLERARMTQETEMKKRKIDRETVEDELDRDFEVTFDYENEGEDSKNEE